MIRLIILLLLWNIGQFDLILFLQAKKKHQKPWTERAPSLFEAVQHVMQHAYQRLREPPHRDRDLRASHRSPRGAVEQQPVDFVEIWRQNPQISEVERLFLSQPVFVLS